MLTYKKPEECRFDEVSLGEIMLRFDPGEGRVHTARSFTVWEGGGEYNVARGLRRCFGMRTAVVTAFADNPVGRLIEDFILQGGVATDFVKWVPYDGIGRTVRNGLNFVERGFGCRGAKSCSDRGNTAISQLKAGDIDWDTIFGKYGVRHFHTGGIFAALSDTTPDVAIEALKAAKKYGTVTSYDLNYRPSLWKAIGGVERARSVNREIAIGAGEEVFLRFETLEQGKKYIVKSTGNADTYGELYRSSALISSADGGGAGENFSISFTKNFGTYYLVVKLTDKTASATVGIIWFTV